MEKKKKKEDSVKILFISRILLHVLCLLWNCLIMVFTKWTWLPPAGCHSFKCRQHRHHSNCCVNLPILSKNKAYRGSLPLHSWSLWWQTHYSSTCEFESSSSWHFHKSSSMCQILVLCWQIDAGWFTIIHFVLFFFLVSEYIDLGPIKDWIPLVCIWNHGIYSCMCTIMRKPKDIRKGVDHLDQDLVFLP